MDFIRISRAKQPIMIFVDEDAPIGGADNNFDFFFMIISRTSVVVVMRCVQ